MSVKRKRIAITAGEPASISTEITIKSLLSKEINEEVDIIVVTDPILLEKTGYDLKKNLKINILKKENFFLDYKKQYINVLPLKLKNNVIHGKLDIKNCSFVKESILTCVNLIKNNFAHAIVTNPINKYIMKKSGFIFEGHTEYLGSLSTEKNEPIMLLESKELKVVPLTTHIPLSEVSKKITKEILIKKIQIIDEELKMNFDINKPKIFVSGLNPHSGDNGEVGREEIDSISPAIKYLNMNGYDVTGPISSDTLFQKNMRNSYDIAICMYHDQALIPIKSLSFNDIVNITLGIDFIRTSPDHGTALDISGMNKANPKSLINAINKAKELIIKKIL